MDYGHFSDDGREFIISRPDTPRPWTNCLTNGAYCAVVSQTGGGYSFIGGPGYDRITRADPDIATSDRPGRYVYVRDNGSGEYFSVGWQPVRRTPDSFECRHSPGVTRIESSCLGIKGGITFFVTMDDNIEIWRVSLENTRDEPADLSIFTYIEWVLGNYADDFEDRQASNLFNTVRFQDNYIVATKRAWRRPDSASITLRESRPAGGPKFLPETVTSNQTWGKWAFIALSLPVDSFDCDKEAFAGRYGDLGKPQAVEQGRCSNSEGDGRNAAGVLQADVVIQPGETLSFDVFVGIALHEGDPSGIVARYGEPGVVDEKLEAVKRYWDSYLSKLTVATPDPDVNRAVNIWDKYQAWVSIRSAGMQSLYRGGASVIGFRESCFDTFAALPMDYDVSKHRIVSLMQHQHRDGSAVHYWEPRSDVGPRTGQLDDSLWLAFATVNYVKETGDLDFLDDRIKCYYSQSPATVYEHLIKALDFCLSQMSSRGLALLGPGDWNDALDQAGRGGKGESIVTSMMLCRMLTEAAEVARLMGDPARERGWIARAREIRKRVNEVGWDGKWYIRATDDKGEAIGSSANASGKTYSTPQSWAVISETAPVERAVQAMDSVREHLETPYGPALVLPAYQRADARIGTSTRFSPGMRENGGISTLAACWAIIAECKLGHGARAHEILKKTLHSTRAEDPERYLVEPYAHSEYVAGPDSDVFGRGGFTWAPGVAAWVWRTCIDWICGVRPDYKGLIVDPCVPPGWKEFSVVRPFREAEYRITVHNPNGVEKGVIEVTVDGKKPRTNHHIPAYKDRKVHEVEVLMG